MPTAAGIVLAGGRSTRMGMPKAALEWHESTLLRHVVGLVGRGVGGPVVVVRAPGQALPSLPTGVAVVEDAHEGRGPLEALAAGLEAIDADAAFVSSTDSPLLHPAFVRRVLRALDDGSDVALPHARGYPQPLAAAYRARVLEAIRQRLAADQVRLGELFGDCRVRWLNEEDLLADPELADADPDLDSLVNLNEPSEYEAARARPAPEVTVERFGTVRAATLGAAAAAAGMELEPGQDPFWPLVAGDVVAFGVV